MNELEPNQKKSLEIGDVINNAIEIYKKTALIGGLGFMVLIFALITFFIIGINSLTTMERFAEFMKTFKPEELSLNGKLIYIGVTVLITALISPFVGGMLKMAHDADTNQEVVFSAMWAYVNSPQFIHIVLGSTVITLFSVGFNMLLIHLMSGTVSSVIGFVISYTFSILTFIAIPIIVFENKNFTDAIKGSITIIAKHFLVVLLLMLIGGILSAVGIILFCFGLFFTLPFQHAIQYSIYKRLK